MKNVKTILGVFAFVAAIGSAFATRAIGDQDLYREGSSEPCEKQTECTLTTGNPCSFTVYEDEGCNDIVDKKRL